MTFSWHFLFLFDIAIVILRYLGAFKLISRFYRDAVVFEQLSQTLPTLIQLGRERRDSSIRCWCAGCASGEEVYTLKLIESGNIPKAIRVEMRNSSPSSLSFSV